MSVRVTVTDSTDESVIGRSWVTDEDGSHRVVHRVYVASSWRNPAQPDVIEAIRDEGHEAYDFRHPEPGDNGFHWSEIDREWTHWSPAEYIQGLAHPIAEAGFAKDKAAMEWADTFVLVLPCGRSAHLELGWAIGSGRRSAILVLGETPDEVTMKPGQESIIAELMYKLADLVTPSLGEVLEWIEESDG